MDSGFCCSTDPDDSDIDDQFRFHPPLVPPDRVASAPISRSGSKGPGPPVVCGVETAFLVRLPRRMDLEQGNQGKNPR